MTNRKKKLRILQIFLLMMGFIIIFYTYFNQQKFSKERIIPKEIEKKVSGKKIVTYGLSQKSNYSATNIKVINKKNSYLTSFDLIENFEKKKIYKNFLTPLLGDHNIKNTLASISVSRELKVS